MPTLTELLEAGAHFGHKKEKSFPRAKQFIYTIRDSVYVINLEKTLEQLEKAVTYLKKEISAGKTVLFLGTKSQAKEIVKNTALNLHMPYMVERWPGGTLTNFETIRKSLKTLNNLEEQIKSPEFTKFTKKERKRIEEKAGKLNLVFEGIKDLNNLPDVLFVVDTAKELVAVKEARKINIPIIGICDTNANPDIIDIPIPANDDSKNTIKIILEKIEESLEEKKEIKKEKK
ncbi:MAG: 30S ribosomal protein S2 [Berkelbacteria bacterium GW2011_GWA1_36_9]|uniref:Small ribosomal subunit protein uS2 n=1 Tax=Berkelbacteria bacterium GW2011_GWA1_36_9 TaxID=1618331 RepID=A0A0G0FFV8_9BACT|nr:MAG: 30S ribosomal protein S2 [Berkelbacteria bacterium GW2011_GWA1_36_9]